MYRGQYDTVVTTLRSVSNSLSNSARNAKLISISLKQKQYSVSAWMAMEIDNLR